MRCTKSVMLEKTLASSILSRKSTISPAEASLCSKCFHCHDSVEILRNSHLINWYVAVMGTSILGFAFLSKDVVEKLAEIRRLQKPFQRRYAGRNTRQLRALSLTPRRKTRRYICSMQLSCNCAHSVCEESVLCWTHGKTEPNFTDFMRFYRLCNILATRQNKLVRLSFASKLHYTFVFLLCVLWMMN